MNTRQYFGVEIVSNNRKIGRQHAQSGSGFRMKNDRCKLKHLQTPHMEMEYLNCIRMFCVIVPHVKTNSQDLENLTKLRGWEHEAGLSLYFASLLNECKW